MINKYTRITFVLQQASILTALIGCAQQNDSAKDTHHTPVHSIAAAQSNYTSEQLAQCTAILNSNNFYTTIEDLSPSGPNGQLYEQFTVMNNIGTLKFTCVVYNSSCLAGNYTTCTLRDEQPVSMDLSYCTSPVDPFTGSTCSSCDVLHWLTTQEPCKSITHQYNLPIPAGAQQTGSVIGGQGTPGSISASISSCTSVTSPVVGSALEIIINNDTSNPLTIAAINSTFGGSSGLSCVGSGATVCQYPISLDGQNLTPQNLVLIPAGTHTVNLLCDAACTTQDWGCSLAGEVNSNTVYNYLFLGETA